MTTSLSLGVTVASAAVSAGSTLRCGAAASRCVSHAAPTTSAAASSQRFIGIPLCDGPHRKVLQPVVAGPQERCRALPRFGDEGGCGGNAILRGLSAVLGCSLRPTGHRGPHRRRQLAPGRVLPARVVRGGGDTTVGEGGPPPLRGSGPRPRREPRPPP